MLPEWCPYVIEMVSRCFRYAVRILSKWCPDVAETYIYFSTEDYNNYCQTPDLLYFGLLRLITLLSFFAASPILLNCSI